ncbi:methyltransferase domain-containing protein [Streptomyces sp. NPDC127098]|uniref:methyltransferase domain-containing protein n=1 Tax=Streptomyces sp. NPDC127098 TaxID=3347137 RepID=UPI00364B89B6
MTSLDDLRQRHDLQMQADGDWPADSPWIRAAVAATPRDHYTPDRVWVVEGGRWAPVDRDADPDRWAAAVYASPGNSTVTQVRNSTSTSNVIATVVAAAMLDHLDLEPGHRVLELGTGTGWTAALMTRRTGPDSVITLDIDAELTAGARERLDHHGVRARVETADGLAGWPAGAPYDRVIAGFVARRIPWAWIEQTRPEGLIVTPWGQGLTTLIVDEEGSSATGWIQQATRFIPDRHTLTVSRTWHQIRDDGLADHQRSFDRDLAQFQHNAHLLWALSVLLPEVWISAHSDARGLLVTLHDGDASWALLAAPPTGEAVAFEGGPRQLAAEVEEAWDAWLRAGSPDIYSFGVTVTPDQQWVWCGDPANGPWDPR